MKLSEKIRAMQSKASAKSGKKEISPEVVALFKLLHTIALAMEYRVFRFEGKVYFPARGVVNSLIDAYSLEILEPYGVINADKIKDIPEITEAMVTEAKKVSDEKTETASANKDRFSKYF